MRSPKNIQLNNQVYIREESREMNEYLYEMIKDYPDDEFEIIWTRNKVKRTSESEEIEDEVLCM